MREPYRTLFLGYENHWLLAPYLADDYDEPDWLGLANEERLDALSSGEKVLLDFAAAWRNCQVHLDEASCYRVGLALQRAYGAAL